MTLFARRVGAYLADCAILFAVLAPTSLLALTAAGIEPADLSQAGIYLTIVVTFSPPTWVYFTVSEFGGRASLGKRLFGLTVAGHPVAELSFGRAVIRTAVKLVPWELSHVAFFLVPALGARASMSGFGAAIAYGLTSLYLIAAWRTGGCQSVHDRVAGTFVERSTGPALAAL